MNRNVATVEAIQANVDVNARGCWIWRGSKNRKGYAQIRLAGPRVYVHRAVWELKRGPISEGLFVLHRCDTPACCNVDHLFLGTKGDNNRDRVIKGRSYSVLTEAQVIECRRRVSAGDRAQTLAMEFGVSERTMLDLLCGKTWSHLPGARTLDRATPTRLTEEQVSEVLSLAGGLLSHEEIARRFGVHRATIGRICSGKNHLNVGAGQ